MVLLRWGMLLAAAQFPLAHWRGCVPLLPTLVITLLGLRFLILYFGGIPVLAVDAGVLIWQVVGSLRSHARKQKDLPNYLMALGAYAAVVTCVLMMTWSQLDQLAGGNVAATPVDAPQTSGVEIVGTSVHLKGPISFQMYSALDEALRAQPHLNEIVLESGGGRVFAARGIARLIRVHALDTHVETTCASACTLAFIAGVKRSLGPDARLGFHGYAVQGNIAVNALQDEQDKDGRTFLDQGVSAAFVQKMFQRGPNEMWFPSLQDLANYGIIRTP